MVRKFVGQNVQYFFFFLYRLLTRKLMDKQYTRKNKMDTKQQHKKYDKGTTNSKNQCIDHLAILGFNW